TSFNRALGEIREDISLNSEKIDVSKGSQPQYVYHPLKPENTGPVKKVVSKTIPELIRTSQQSDLSRYPDTTLTPEPSSLKIWKQAGWGDFSDAPPWMAVRFFKPGEQADGAKTHPKEVRYTYAVYDEGGALDLNAVGSPDGKSSNISGKGSSFWADLNQIPDWNQDLSNQVFAWKAGSNSKAKNDFTNWLLDSQKRGFQWAGENETRFLSRQEMLDYFKENGVSESAIPYFTHFSRELNQSSWRPTFNGTTFSTFKFANAFQFKYKDEANQKWGGETHRMYNRDFAGLLRNDGTSLIRQRFALSRINLLKNAGTVTKSDEIYKYFGITRSSPSSPWVYDHGAKDANGNTKIYQLNDPEFLTQNREPDFFELLQAGILYGSTGLTCNSSDTVVNTTLKRVCESSFLTHAMDFIDVPTQIFKIGLNIIDQWDEDSMPTRLQVLGRDYGRAGLHGAALPAIASDGTSIRYLDQQTMQLMGQENIPFVSEIGIAYYRLKAGAAMGANTQPAARNNIYSWFVPEVWNIYRSPATTPSSSVALRFYAWDGSPDMLNVDYNYLLAGVPTNSSAVSTPVGTKPNYKTTPCSILFQYSSSAPVKSPTYLGKTLSGTSQTDSLVSINSPQDGTESDFCGIPLGVVTCTQVTVANSFNLLKQINVNNLCSGASTPVSFQWQVQTAGGTWVPIQNFQAFTLGNTSLTWGVTTKMQTRYASLYSPHWLAGSFRFASGDFCL
ncbi:MAG: hypothetical protein V4507_05895, partial [Verrucomicrobiota bacterium]